MHALRRVPMLNAAVALLTPCRIRENLFQPPEAAGPLRRVAAGDGEGGELIQRVQLLARFGAVILLPALFFKLLQYLAGLHGLYGLGQLGVSSDVRCLHPLALLLRALAQCLQIPAEVPLRKEIAWLLAAIGGGGYRLPLLQSETVQQLLLVLQGAAGSGQFCQQGVLPGAAQSQQILQSEMEALQCGLASEACQSAW